MTDEVEGKVEAAIVRVGVQFVRGLYAFVAVAIIGAAGAAAWVTETNGQIDILIDSVKGLRSDFENKVPPVWVERHIDQAEKHLARIEARLDGLEFRVLSKKESK